jgi:hypothetical protein
VRLVRDSKVRFTSQPVVDRDHKAAQPATQTQSFVCECALAGDSFF